MKTNIFNNVNFTPTKFDTAEDKAKFARHFIKFILEGFQQKHFHKWFYTRLSMTRGHIAHYNQGGFFEEWFADKESQLRFLQHWLNQPIYGDPAFTYSDVERLLQTWIETSPHILSDIEQQVTELVQRESLEQAENNFFTLTPENQKAFLARIGK